MADHFATLERESKQFLTQYGDFTAFLYRPDFDHFLREQVLCCWQPAEKCLIFDSNHWVDKHPFNFPGPFYTGASDTCGMGVDEAARNVMNDGSYQEFVFRQPTTYAELLGVLYAGLVEPFDSYSANGHDYWTYQECRTWWRNRAPILRSLTEESVITSNQGQAQRYMAYLQGEAEMDLRRYCYFLENGVYPTKRNGALPEL